MARALGFAIACLALLAVHPVGAYSEEKAGAQPPGKVQFDTSDPAWGLNGVTQYASGNCKVKLFASVSLGPAGFLCGTDRDDDTFLTNVDNSPSDSGRVSNDADGFDDDFAVASFGSGEEASVNVCLRSDVAAFTVAELIILGQTLYSVKVEDDTGAVNGDRSWDDVVIVIQPESLFVGAFDATLTLTTAAGCTGNVSGHTHG